jgi:nitroreductase
MTISERAILDDVAKAVPPFTMLKEATLGILVCGDLTRVNPGSTIFVQSCSAATENILLAAHASGLGAVWLGVFPLADRVNALKQLFSIPETVALFSFVSIGHPAEQKPPEDRYDAGRVHVNRW